MVVIGLPNHLHLPAVRVAAAAKKAIVCTKPLARNGAEAAEIVNVVRKAGVMHGYAETEVFSPDVMRAREMIEKGAIGDVLTVRAREAHSGPHAPHFWDAETAGGGALLDMGCHTVEAARYFFGKDHKIKDVFAWGATLVHREKTKGEDNAVLLLRLEDGRTSLTEASWTAKGGMELRNEVYGTKGRIVTDTSSTRVRAFIEESAGYLMEKADAETGWVFPIPDEARVYGYQEEMRHFVECYAAGKQPREDFVDGYVVNRVLDAAYISMKSGHWEPVQIDSKVTG
jgi:predicted dehydrogenase